MTVLSNFALSARLLAVVTVVHAGIMVEVIDGSLGFARRAGDGSFGVRLTNKNDVSYLTSVLMGNPPQTIQMSPSLSQNFIAVASPPTGVNDQSFYNPSISTSFTAGIGTASTQTISGGSVQGIYADETCTLQSATSASFFSFNASIILTNSAVTNDLYPVGARGILGYGLGSPSDAPPNTSLIGTFLPSNFSHAVCGIELNHFDDPVPDGILMMGAVDPTVFTGDFTNTMVPANSPTSWSIPFDNLTYIANGVSQSMVGMLASIDIYHSDIQITSDAAAQLYAGVPGSQAISNAHWSIPCTSKFPITLTFSSTPFTINERDTIVKQADGSCIGVVSGGAKLIGRVGAPFLRNVYTQFFADQANGTVTFGVGFAVKKLRQASGSATSPSTSTQRQLTDRPSATSTGVGQSSRAQLNVQDVGVSLRVAMILVTVILSGLNLG